MFGLGHCITAKNTQIYMNRRPHCHVVTTGSCYWAAHVGEDVSRHDYGCQEAGDEGQAEAAVEKGNGKAVVGPRQAQGCEGQAGRQVRSGEVRSGQVRSGMRGGRLLTYRPARSDSA